MMVQGRRVALASPRLVFFSLVALLGACSRDDGLHFTAVTFNTGGPAAGSDERADGFTEERAAFSDEFYGNGLALLPAVEATRQFFASRQPDIVAFQEIFFSGECPSVPAEARPGFVCDGWREGDETVAQLVLGAGYQVACNLGKPDKCLGVRLGFGRFRGCDQDLCLDGLDGAVVDGCGGGSRIGRGVVELVAGGELTVVGVHGTSGFTEDDMACRARQFEQVFVDVDGERAANGARNVILGDFNTDPGRAVPGDTSAARLLELAEPEFHFVTEVGPRAPGTYLGGLANIDHVMSDVLTGACTAAGITEGVPPIYELPYFDHTAILCVLEE